MTKSGERLLAGDWAFVMWLAILWGCWLLFPGAALIVACFGLVALLGNEVHAIVRRGLFP